MIEIFADVWCPFAWVGLHMTRRRRDEHAAGQPLSVRAWPLELVNGKPQDPAKAAGHVHDLRTQLGVDLFSGFEISTFPTTSIPALALVAAAGRVEKGEAAAFRVREALWEEGRDIGDGAVIAGLATELGVTVEDADFTSVDDDWREGQRRGVVGSPHFFCGDRDAFCPSLLIDRDAKGDLQVHADPSRLEEFLLACWPA